MPKPASAEVERFRGIVAARLGLQFEDAKLGLLGDVLRRRVEADRRDCDHYLARLEADAARDEVGALAEELTVGETYFFRNREQFRAFTEIVLPERMNAQRQDRNLRFLSAGCASGEEAYTLAIIVKEMLADPSWTVTIDAVDINPAALIRASSGRFSPWALRETPRASLERWFRPAGRDYVLADEIRTAVRFGQRNITADSDIWRPYWYDAVFCRNVIMYFAPQTMQAAVGRIARSLVPGGFLFLGHAETLRGLSQDFTLQHTHETFYYRTRKSGEEEGPQPAPPVFPAPRSMAPAAPPSDPTGWVDAIAQASARIRSLAAPVPVAGPEKAPISTSAGLAPVFELILRERFSEALALVQDMAPEAAQDPDTRLLTAVLLAHSGEYASAAEAAQRLLALDDLNAGAHYVLALSSEAGGDTPSAVNHHKLAAYLNADFAMPRLHLGLIARAAGDRGAARRELNQALLLLQREEASRLMLFGGGFSRESLVALCRAELSSIEARR